MPPAPAISGLSTLLQTQLSVTTNFSSEPITGTLTALSTTASTIAILTKENDLHFLPINTITSLNVLSAPPGETKFAEVAGPRINRVDLERVDGRLREKVGGEVDKGRAKEVGKTAWSLYEAIKKTMKCRWEGKKMIVLDSVEVVEPWDIESCRAIGPDKGRALEWVRKVLQGEREKLGLPAAERKGG